MAKKEKPDAPDESKAANVVPLGMGDHLVLQPGMVVQANATDPDTLERVAFDPVSFNGDVSAFVNELAALIHPLRVGVTPREVERDAVIDGVTTSVKVTEYTVRLLDG